MAQEFPDFLTLGESALHRSDKIQPCWSLLLQRTDFQRIDGFKFNWHSEHDIYTAVKLQIKWKTCANYLQIGA